MAPVGHASPWLRLRSDDQLVGLFRSGSEDAFRVIHDRYRQRLFAYSRQMLSGSASDAEDVMQDVFLRAYRALRADERPVSLRSWLYRVAHNRCIDTLRRPNPEASDVFEMSRPPAQDPCDAAERREDLQRLVADVRRLPDQQRSALLMREMDGMSYADLAHALDTSIPAIKSLLVRARIGLVEAIEARDTDCADIRHDLAASYDRGVRSSGRARRHLRDCSACTTYRAQLRGLRQNFAALSPGVAAPGLLAKLLGLGGATSGAGVAAGGAASGSTVAIGGGAAAAVSVSKIAAVVGSAAALTGGAVEVKKIVVPAPERSSQPAYRSAVAASLPSAVALRSSDDGAAAPASRRASPPAAGLSLRPPIPMGPSLIPLRDNGNGSGGMLAPAEEPAVDGALPPADPAASEDHGGVVPIGEDVLPGVDGEAATAGGHEEPSPGPSPSPSEDDATTGSSTSGSGTSGTASSSSAGDSPDAGSGSSAPSSTAGRS